MKQMATVISSFNLVELNKFAQVVSILYTSSPNDPQVVDLMCFLATRNLGHDNQTPLRKFVDCFVANLPKVGKSQALHSWGMGVQIAKRFTCQSIVILVI